MYPTAPLDPATWGVGRVEDEPVWLLLRSAREMAGADGADCAGEPTVSFPVMPFNTWQFVKIRLKQYWPGLSAVPERYIRLLYKGIELKTSDMIDDYALEGGAQEKPIELHYLVINKGGKSKGDIGLYIDAQVTSVSPPTLKRCVTDALASLLTGIIPRLTDDGTGATYMLRDSANRHTLAVFKPKDEEAFAPQNPRGYEGRENSTGLRQGVFSTQQAAREVAAYLLDHEKFAGVPETTLVHGKHPKFVPVGGKTVWKVGAFQAFVETKDAAGNFAAQVFSVTDVHRVGILDIRIVNLDRNDGNLLVRHGRSNSSYSQAGRHVPNASRFELIPIDHGLSLPDRLEVYTDDIAWMSWRQAHKPFGEKELEYIQRLSGSRDARLLTMRLGIRRECLRLMEVTTKLLQVGAEHGLTLYEIGTILYRDGSDGSMQPSPLEKIIEKSVDTALAIAGEGPVAGTKTLAGLDLQTSRQKMKLRNSVDAEHANVAASQRLSASPFQSPVISAQAAGDMPPRFSLESPSSPDPPQSPEGGMAGATVIGLSLEDDPKLVGELLAEKQTSKSLRHLYKAGSSARLRKPTSTSRTVARNASEAETKEGGIFARRGLQASDWSQEMENIFKKQVTEELSEYISKTFQRSEASEEAMDAGTAEDDSPPSPVDKSLASAFGVMPNDLGPPRARYIPPHLRNQVKEDAGDAASSDSCGMNSTEPTSTATASDASAAVQQESQQPPRPRYVPPQRRALAAAEAASGGGALEAVTEAQQDVATTQDGAGEPQGAGNGPASASDSLATIPEDVEVKPAKPKWIPSFLRRKMEAEASAAADSRGAADSGNSSVSSTAPAASSTPAALPTDESGGTSRYGYCVNQGPRPGMEDAIDARPRLPGEILTEFYAVYDGHSGVAAVDFVKRRLPEVISGHGGFNDPERMQEVLSDACTVTDDELLAQFRQQQKPANGKRPESADNDAGVGEESGEPTSASYLLSSGCVACIALIRGTAIHIVNLGDCRAVLCRGGEMVPLTVDHSPLENEEERKRLQALSVEVSCDGYLHGRIGVSRAFGDWAWHAEEKCKGLICNPDVSQAEAADDAEFLLLACDGIFEKMSTKEAGQIVRRRLRATGDAKAAAEALVKNAVKRNGTDNLSAVIVIFNLPASNDSSRVAPRLFSAGGFGNAASSASADAPPKSSEADASAVGVATDVPPEAKPDSGSQ